MGCESEDASLHINIPPGVIILSIIEVIWLGKDALLDNLVLK